MPPELLKPAQTLEDVYKTLSPMPLVDSKQLEAFYIADLNDVRGGDKIERIKLNLGRSYGGGFYHALLHGHQGVGKSTELARLIHETRDQFRAIRFSALKDLNPAGYKPFDVLLVMLIMLVEETDKVKENSLSPALLREVMAWFGQRTRIYKQVTEVGGEVSAGAGPKGGSPIGIVLGLFASIKGMLKYTTTSEDDIVRYELALIPELVSLVNRLLDECRTILHDTYDQEWLFIGEDFDKAIGRPELAKDLFINHANIFYSLHTHLIFNVPIELVYSGTGKQLESTGCHVSSILDTPVYDRDHAANESGRRAIEEVLARRMSADLFDPGQMMRLIVASGGNLRDLFVCVSEAADTAILRKTPSGKIAAPDVDSAIAALRTEYLRHLGESVYDEQQAVSITYEQKAKRLLEVYSNARKPTVSDPVLYSLLRARAVQEFNSEGWYGVHPLVVNILAAQGHLEHNTEGKVPGGTL